MGSSIYYLVILSSNRNRLAEQAKAFNQRVNYTK